MGCLNSTGQFGHWFGNIHLSGPCTRACYFCIGQHMMVQDSLNTLDAWPLPGLRDFVAACHRRAVVQVNLTGTNTDPMLYRHHDELVSLLDAEGFSPGIRTNGIGPLHTVQSIMDLYGRGSLTICSVDPDINTTMMGGPPADVASILTGTRQFRFKVNIVLGPENRDDVFQTLKYLGAVGVSRVNLREPYGQPSIGDPLQRAGFHQDKTDMGMPTYQLYGMRVTYWDVHYVEVESVNLYATGHTSETYPITRGCVPGDQGTVRPQASWSHGRHTMQWKGKGIHPRP